MFDDGETIFEQDSVKLKYLVMSSDQVHRRLHSKISLLLPTRTVVALSRDPRKPTATRPRSTPQTNSKNLLHSRTASEYHHLLNNLKTKEFHMFITREQFKDQQVHCIGNQSKHSTSGLDNIDTLLANVHFLQDLGKKSDEGGQRSIHLMLLDISTLVSALIATLLNKTWTLIGIDGPKTIQPSDFEQQKVIYNKIQEFRMQIDKVVGRFTFDRAQSVVDVEALDIQEKVDCTTLKNQLHQVFTWYSRHDLPSFHKLNERFNQISKLNLKSPHLSNIEWAKFKPNVIATLRSLFEQEQQKVSKMNKSTLTFSSKKANAEIQQLNSIVTKWERKAKPESKKSSSPLDLKSNKSTTDVDCESSSDDESYIELFNLAQNMD